MNSVCAFCGMDPYEYVDVGVGWVPVAVTCCYMAYSAMGGPVGPPSEVVPWIEKGLAGFDRYQHLLGQISIEVDGDSARATAYFTNPMVAVGRDGTEKLFEVGGYYHHELRRTPDGWRSVHIIDEHVWSRGF